MARWFRTLVAPLVASSLACAEPSIGDVFVHDATYVNTIGMGGGTHEVRSVLDSIQVSGDTTRCVFRTTTVSVRGSFEFSSESMSALVQGNRQELVTIGSLPGGVRTRSEALKSSKWILSDRSTLIFYGSIRPFSGSVPIPILDSSAIAGEILEYVVRTSDTSGVKWSNRKPGNSVFRGRPVRYANARDSVGDSLVAWTPAFSCQQDAPLWGAKPGNPWSFAAINLSSSMRPLEGSKMAMGEGCYGMALASWKSKESAALQPRGDRRAIGAFGSARTWVRPNGAVLRPEPRASGIAILRSDSSTTRGIRVK